MSTAQDLGKRGASSCYLPRPPARSRIGAKKRFPCLRMEDPRSYIRAGNLGIWRDLVVWWASRSKELIAQLEYKAGQPVGWIESEAGSLLNTWQAFPPYINTTAKAKAWLWRKKQKEIQTKIAFYQKELEKMKGVKLDGNY